MRITRRDPIFADWEPALSDDGRYRLGDPKNGGKAPYSMVEKLKDAAELIACEGRYLEMTGRSKKGKIQWNMISPRGLIITS